MWWATFDRLNSTLYMFPRISLWCYSTGWSTRSYWIMLTLRWSWNSGSLFGLSFSLYQTTIWCWWRIIADDKRWIDFTFVNQDHQSQFTCWTLHPALTTQRFGQNVSAITSRFKRSNICANSITGYHPVTSETGGNIQHVPQGPDSYGECPLRRAR